MIKTETKEALDYLATDLAKRIRDHLMQSMQTCIRCSHFDDKPEVCRLANARPPARIIALGCEKYDETAPF